MRIPYLRIILVLVGVLIGVWLLWPRPEPPIGPTGPQLPVTPGQSHVRQDLPPPAGQPSEQKIRGVLHIKIKPPPHTDEPGQTRDETYSIDVLIPEGEELAPIVRTPGLPSGVTVEPTYQDYRDPFFKIKVNLLAGASVDPAVGVSPYGGISFLVIAEKVRLAFGADRWAAGPAVHWEFFREFNIGARWGLLSYNTDSNAASFSISYRF